LMGKTWRIQEVDPIKMTVISEEGTTMVCPLFTLLL
jgi:hypothetical protein